MLECHDSEAGYHVKDADHTKQVVCDNGGFQAGTKTNSCTPCASGHYVPADGQPHTTQAKAQQGWYVADADKTKEVMCCNGKYQDNAGQNKCENAASGHFVPDNEMPHKSQTAAQRGYYVADEDKTRQIKCTNGSFQDEEGRNTCKDATAGHYVPDDGLAHPNETACDAGHYQPDPRATACSAVCDSGKYQNATGQASCIMCETGMGAGFSTPDDGAAHTTCERWIDDDLDVADLKVDPTVLYPPMSDARFDGNECETVVGNKTWLVPMVSEGLPAGTHDLTITHGGEDIVLQVTLTEDYTTPAPMPAFDGTSVTSTAPGPLCSVEMPIGGVGPKPVTPIMNSDETGVLCQSTTPANGITLQEHFPMAWVEAGDQLCILSEKSTFTGPGALTATVDGADLPLTQADPHRLCATPPSGYYQVTAMTLNGDTIDVYVTPQAAGTPMMLYLLGIAGGSVALVATLVLAVLAVLVCLCCVTTCCCVCGAVGLKAVLGGKKELMNVMPDAVYGAVGVISRPVEPEGTAVANPLFRPNVV